MGSAWECGSEVTGWEARRGIRPRRLQSLSRVALGREMKQEADVNLRSEGRGTRGAFTLQDCRGSWILWLTVTWCHQVSGRRVAWKRLSLRSPWTCAHGVSAASQLPRPTRPLPPAVRRLRVGVTDAEKMVAGRPVRTPGTGVSLRDSFRT